MMGARMRAAKLLENSKATQTNPPPPVTTPVAASVEVDATQPGLFFSLLSMLRADDPQQWPKRSPDRVQDHTTLLEISFLHQSTSSYHVDRIPTQWDLLRHN